MAATLYGDISPRTAAFVVKELLKRGMPYLIFEKFGQAKPLPANSTKTIKFRRYFLDTTLNDLSTKYNPKDYFSDDATSQFDPAAKVLSEGVTPGAQKLEFADLEATLVQYGDLITITDVIQDTHEDNVLKEAVDILGEQAAIILEKIRFNVLKAGTQVVYANDDGSPLRSEVNTVFTAAVQRVVTRNLKRQLAKPITSVVKSTPSYGTEPIAPSFVAICHPDLEYDIRRAVGFVPAEKYGAMGAWEGEIGKISDCRYVLTTIAAPWASGGATGGTNVIQTNGSNADVYPILYFARDAYALVPFKGKNAVSPTVVNATPSDSDPLAQRAHVGWKAYSTCIILNDAWMARAEVACTASGYLTD
jgi:N4-gp56 family major capsid protein